LTGAGLVCEYPRLGDFFRLHQQKEQSIGQDDTIAHDKLQYYDALHPRVSDWNTSDPLMQRSHHFLENYVCKTIGAYCHPLLDPVPQRRTHRVAQTSSSSVLLA
jgi:hypothetical protein